MVNLENAGKVITTDVLVIGGGIGGLTAALRAREQDVDVLIVDKANVGFAGMPSRAGNGILTLKKDSDIDEYVGYLVKNLGVYLTDQDAQTQLAQVNYEAHHKVMDWGVKITTDENGEIGFFPNPCAPWYNSGIELNCTETLRKTALKNGIKIQNNVQITALIKSGDVVCGAVGYHIIDGTFYIFRAKAVITACAACGFRTIRMFNGRGEGVKLAWDAGAQMRNAEYGNFVEIVSDVLGESIYGTQTIVYNQKGENVWDKYVKWPAPDVCIEMILGIEKEYREGNGPLYVDFSKMPEEWKVIGQSGGELMGMTRFFPDKLSWMGRCSSREHEYADLGAKPTVKTGLHGNSGPVRVDLDFKTTVDGLYVVGVDCCNGSGAFGAIPQPGGQRGSGLTFGITTGYIGGAKAAQYAKSVHQLPVPDVQDILQKKEEAFQCLNQEDGVSAYELIDRIQDAVCPFDVCIRRSEKSLTGAIEKIESIKADLPKMKAKDYHELMVCNETKAMALVAELMLRSALERKESRGFHYREDYPETDNKNWLKWTVADNVDGKVVISTEDIPMERYKFKPEGWEAN